MSISSQKRIRFFQFRQGRIDADRIAGEDAEALIPLRDEALDQLGLEIELPVRRNFEIDRGDAEILLRVGCGLLPGLEIGMRPAGNEGDLVVGRDGRSGEENQPEKRGTANETANGKHRILP